MSHISRFIRAGLIAGCVAAFFPQLFSQETPAAKKDEIAALVEKESASLLALYRGLHQDPELSFQEEATAKKIAAELEKVGCKVTTGVGGHGLVGVLENGPGPVVMIRTDLDALPIVEATGLEFASKKKVRSPDGKETGVMHACGHDVHMSVFVGTARVLAATKNRWKGTAVFVGQPAEERGKGAEMMIADGLFRRFPVPNRAIALHCAAALPAGKVGYCEGYALANVDSVDVVVRGVGGHGAYPNTTKDPIVLACQIVLALQTLVSRERSPLEPAVLTVGSIHGGTKHNIISDEVKIEITCRSYSDAVRKLLLDGIVRIANGCAVAAGIPLDRMPIVTVLDESIPSTYNDPDLTKLVAGALRAALGDDAVQKTDPVMGGEDFGCYGRTEPKVPISMFWLGVVEPSKFEKYIAERKSLPSLHSAEFAPDAPRAIPVGVQCMVAAALAAFAVK